MGRALRLLACDNCIPGDASGWYLPLTALLLTAAVGAAVLLVLAAGRTGARAWLPRVAAVALLLGPGGGVFAVGTHVRHGRTHCGSALPASLARPRPGHTLDAAQAGCRAAGERVVRGATAYGIAVTALAVVALAAAAVPPRRRPAVA